MADGNAKWQPRGNNGLEDNNVASSANHGYKKEECFWTNNFLFVALKCSKMHLQELKISNFSREHAFGLLIFRLQLLLWNLVKRCNKLCGEPPPPPQKKKKKNYGPIAS